MAKLTKKRKRKAINPNSYHGMAIKILERAGKPMKVVDIIEKILKTKKTRSKSPGSTLSAILQRSQYFEPTEFGYYKLKNNYKTAFDKNFYVQVR